IRSYISQPHSLADGLSRGPLLSPYDERETPADPGLAVSRFRRDRHVHPRPFPVPGIQSVPASGTLAIAAASMVSATRSSGSRWWTLDLPQARASAVSSMVSAFR